MEISFGNSVFEISLNREMCLTLLSDIDISESSQDSEKTFGINKTHKVREMFYYDSYGKIMPKTIQVKLKQKNGNELVEFFSD